MHLTSVLLLGASPLALTAPVSNRAFSQTTDSNNEIAHYKRQLQDLGALTGVLGEVFEPLSSLTRVAAPGNSEGALKRRDNEDIESRQLAGLGALDKVLGPLLGALGPVAGGTGAAPGGLGGVLKTRSNEDIHARQLEALGVLSGILGPLTAALASITGLLKREAGESLPNNALTIRQPIELDEVTDLLGSLGNILGFLKRDHDGILEKDEVDTQAETRDLERRQDPIAALINGILTAIAPAIGEFTDPISGLFGGKGWNRRVKKDTGLEALAPLTDALDSSDSLAALVAEATGPLAPIVGGKGFESGTSRRDSGPLGGLGDASAALASAFAQFGEVLGPNALAALTGEITDPLSGLVGGHGY